MNVRMNTMCRCVHFHSKVDEIYFLRYDLIRMQLKVIIR